MFQAETFCSRFRNSDGQGGNYVLILHDISERLRLGEELCHAQKIQAIGTLAGGVAHDFNNILAAIIGFSELALDKVPRDSSARHHLKRTLEAAIRGRDLVRQILAFARRSEADKKPLQLSVVIKETLKLLRASLPSTIDIRLNVTSESGPVTGDPAQMQQVIINLCANAAHAMRARGGTITIDRPTSASLRRQTPPTRV